MPLIFCRNNSEQSKRVECVWIWDQTQNSNKRTCFEKTKQNDIPPASCIRQFLSKVPSRVSPWTGLAFSPSLFVLLFSEKWMLFAVVFWHHFERSDPLFHSCPTQHSHSFFSSRMRFKHFSLERDGRWRQFLDHFSKPSASIIHFSWEIADVVARNKQIRPREKLSQIVTRTDEFVYS